MKEIIAYILFLSICVGCISPKLGRETKNEDKYLKVFPMSTCTNSFCNKNGYKINILHPTENKFATLTCTYEWDKVFALYTVEDKISLLQKLLSFENDTNLCGKRVCRYGYTNSERPVTENYTLQMDALFLLTILTTGQYSLYYCPYPVIIDTVTKQEITNDSEKIKEVFEIYRKWIKENGKTEFKVFHLPLKGSRYQWYGIDTSKYGVILNDNFKLYGLGKAGAVVGICKD